MGARREHRRRAYERGRAWNMYYTAHYYWRCDEPSPRRFISHWLWKRIEPKPADFRKGGKYYEAESL